MKRLWKLSIICFALFMLSACGEEGSAENDGIRVVEPQNIVNSGAVEISRAEEAIELYVDVLRNYISEGKTDFAVSFLDLDDDSTKEMVVFFGESQADGGYLFTIKNGEAVHVVSEDGDWFGQYGGFTYKEKGNVFVAENESVTDTKISHQIFYYTMENGKAVCMDVTESVTQFDNGESRFYVNNTEVESEEFDSIAEKYGLSEMSTVSYSDGVRVTDGQMDGLIEKLSESFQKDGQSVMAEGENNIYEGEYEYPSDYGTGKLIIKKAADGYDISDYESESSYRFLANSSNIERVEDNRVYIKYPEQVFSDGTAVFGYYILDCGEDEVDVYYGKSGYEEASLLYHAVKKEGKSDVQAGGNTASEMTADELLDSFLNGQISAVSSTDPTQTFYITDLNMDSEEWDSYSVGERVDLDNDGENELILCGPYGGRYLDARDNKVYEFARGGGTAVALSYVVYKGDIWILYSNRMNAGYEAYHMEKFEGADHLALEMNFSEELIDANNPESGMKYTLNGAEISYEEYAALGSRIFAAEVFTNK